MGIEWQLFFWDVFVLNAQTCIELCEVHTLEVSCNILQLQIFTKKINEFYFADVFGAATDHPACPMLGGEMKIRSFHFLLLIVFSPWMLPLIFNSLQLPVLTAWVLWHLQKCISFSACWKTSVCFEKVGETYDEGEKPLLESAFPESLLSLFARAVGFVCSSPFISVMFSEELH